MGLLLICGLVNNAINISEHMVSSEKMINELGSIGKVAVAA
jgi:hypothetical protein